MKKQTHLIGRRVKIVQGTRKDMSPWKKNFERHDAVMWCAGDVSVGSTGVIKDVPDSALLLQIEWDHGQKPQGDYIFGFSEIGDNLELI